MRIAIITEGNSAETGGIVNFICEEALQLKKRESEVLSSDVYMVRILPSRLLRWLLIILKRIKQETHLYSDIRDSFFDKDGVRFNNIWIKENVFGFFIRTKITHQSFTRKNLKKILDSLKSYDYVIAHKPQCHVVGLNLWNCYHIPFGAFWHGSELGINAFLSKSSFKQTKKVLETAHDNFFVSKALMNIADGITEEGRKKVIYTGPSDMFYKYTQEEKNELRKRFGVPKDAIVIAYAGHLVELKNVMMLPSIFQCIQKKCKEKRILFWIIGHGELETQLRSTLNNTDVSYRMFGNVPAPEMPDYMNCVDVLTLISKKEGLGLVCLEALKCGAKVFGSLVGGIPEAIGENNCVPLDENFVDNYSNLVAEYIKGGGGIYYNECFTWSSAIDRILQSIRG